MLRLEGNAALVAFPMVFRRNQFHGRLIALFRLPADVAHGFVEQHGHAPCLLLVGVFVQIDAVAGQHFLPQNRHFAIDLHPALFDVVVGFAARAQAQLRHLFGESDGFGHGVLSDFASILG